MTRAGRHLPMPARLDDPRADEILRRLELDVTRRLDGYLHGDYRGLVPGHGSELGETRVYQPGDDIRRIDWNVTARTLDPHVRETIADRELEAWALVDLSPSLDFGTAACEKRDLAIAAVAAVGFLTARTGNRFGAMLLDGHSTHVIPAGSGRVHQRAVLHRLITHPRATVTPPRRRRSAGPVPTTHGDLAHAIGRLAATARRRGLAVVVSDFLAPGAWDDELKRLTVRHDVLTVEVVDPRELELPDVGLLTVVDTETGELRDVATSNPALRERYRAAAAEQRASIATRIRQAGADHLVLRTDRDWLLELTRFVAFRRRRVEQLPRPAR